MSIFVPGSLFPHAEAVDTTLALHTANFDSANAAIASVENGMVAAAAADAAAYEVLKANTFQAGLDARSAQMQGDYNMQLATAIADSNNYHTLFSPSSAYGPIGPAGATAGYTSPYVSGILHQR
ncbi:hypothetical protein DIPPA_28614 [Diplonema papillatum]|nr:hypothetical protein DIPPA_28614 [Diplonema papillatum]